jgi:hypothetical protein
MLRSAILLLITCLPAFLFCQNDTVLTEDFSLGLAGNNPWGAWIIEDSGNDSIWMMANELSPVGDFPAPEVPINSASADNGWVIFDADLHNLNNDPPDSTWGYLVSPVIDMTGMTSVVVEWDQYYRYCCGWKSPITLEVSADGGISWEDYPAHGQYIESADWTSENTQRGRLDITCVAANKPEVQIRFAFNGEHGNNYGLGFWGIDDIVIMENPLEFELEIEKVAVKMQHSLFEYDALAITAIPSLDSICASAYIRNHGRIDPTEMEVEFHHYINTDLEWLNTVTIQNENGIWGCSSNDVIEVSSCTVFQNFSTECYSFKVDLPTDDIAGNNVNRDTVCFFNEIHGPLDFDSWHDSTFGPDSSDIQGLFDPAGIGFIIQNVHEEETCRLFMEFGDSPEWVEMESRLYTQDAMLDDWNTGYESGFYAADPSWANQLVTLHLDGDVTLNQASWYLASAVTEFENEFQLKIRARANADYFHVSRAYRYNRMTEDEHWTPTHLIPMLWADFQWCGSSVDEAHRPSIRISPNPVDKSFNVQLSGIENEISSIHLLDSHGTVACEWTKPDLHAPFFVKNATSGLYILIITTHQGVFTEKLMIVR